MGLRLVEAFVVGNELDFLPELEEEMESEGPTGPTTAPRCNNRGIPAIEATQALGANNCSAARAAGVPDPVGVITRARNRALQMLDNTVRQLVEARRAVCESGANPALQLSEPARCWLRNGMGVNTNEVRVWTASTFEPIRSIAETIRRLIRVRNLLGSRGLRYSCTGVHCNDVPETWAYVQARDPHTGLCLPGTPLMLIRLCRTFWIPGRLPDGTLIPADVQAEFQAQTLVHEASHLTHCTRDFVGQTVGIAECLAQFVAVTNGSPLDPRFVSRCSGTASCRQPAGAATVFHAEHESSNDPYEWPKWPASRTFNPPLQTVPLKPLPPIKPFVPCQSILDDITNLSMALDELQKALRANPPNQATIRNRTRVVTALCSKIIARLTDGTYRGQHCTREDLSHLKIAVNQALNRNLAPVGAALRGVINTVSRVQRTF